jgi:hypothetical protein
VSNQGSALAGAAPEQLDTPVDEMQRIDMQPHTRALIAVSTHAIITGKKIVGIYDHAEGRHLRIAAECRGNRLQALDGDRRARFGGTLPELYDEGDAAFVSLETDGVRASGYDWASSGFYTAEVAERQVQIYDHSESAWFTFDVQLLEDGSAAA